VSTLDEASNVLGALALAVNDQVNDAIAAATGQPVTAASALSSVHQFLGAPSVDTLCRVLGLTHSGAVRLIDRLEKDALITRGPGRDGRSRAVVLTPTGRRSAETIALVRVETLRRALSGLTAEEVATLKGLLDKLTGTAVAVKFERGTAGHRWTCRMCDLTACGRAAGHCPSAETARAIVDREGSAGA
jgi:DNA-binding MarR family transcriptional regulator